MSFTTVTFAALDDEPVYRSLVEARSLRCTFSLVVQAEWQQETIQTYTEPESAVLHFDKIDFGDKTASLIGNREAKDVNILLTSSSLTFIELTPSGNPNFTTIFPVYKNGTQEFIAVTSRHLLLFGQKDDSPFPSQHHGSCRAGQ